MAILIIVGAYTSILILNQPILKKLVNRTELAVHFILFSIIILKEIINFSEFKWIQITSSVLNVILHYGFIFSIIGFIIIFKIREL